MTISTTIPLRQTNYKFIRLTPTQHTIMKMDNVLAAADTSLSRSSIHNVYPTMSITMKHLQTFRHNIQTEHHHKLSYRVIYNHLHIITQSPFILHDRLLYIKIYNIIYATILRCPDNTITAHILRFFLQSTDSISISSTHI